MQTGENTAAVWAATEDKLKKKVCKYWSSLLEASRKKYSLESGKADELARGVQLSGGTVAAADSPMTSSRTSCKKEDGVDEGEIDMMRRVLASQTSEEVITSAIRRLKTESESEQGSGVKPGSCGSETSPSAPAEMAIMETTPITEVVTISGEDEGQAEMPSLRRSLRTRVDNRKCVACDDDDASADNETTAVKHRAKSPNPRKTPTGERRRAKSPNPRKTPIGDKHGVHRSPRSPKNLS